MRSCTPRRNPPTCRASSQRLDAAGARMSDSINEIRATPRPGMVNALIEASICGDPADDEEIRDAMFLLIGGGFDTTTALTAHSLEWLGEHPDERARLRADLPGLIDSATEEFLRVYTPAPGDGRTVTCEYDVAGKKLESGDRLWLSWAMANRDPSVFPDPDAVLIDRKHNRHTSFGLGLHRCIGSNVARAVFKVDARRRPRAHAGLPVRSRRCSPLRHGRPHQRHEAPAGHVHPGRAARSEPRRHHRPLAAGHRRRADGRACHARASGH